MLGPHVPDGLALWLLREVSLLLGSLRLFAASRVVFLLLTGASATSEMPQPFMLEP